MNRLFEFGNNFIEQASTKITNLKISENVGNVVGAFTGGKGNVGSVYEINGRRYTTLRLIAEGGFGFVYQVRDDYNQVYALKRMILQDKERFQAIKNEIDVMNRLRNNNIVKLEGSRILENQERREIEVLMLMELCTGGSVLDIMNERVSRKLEEREILAIFNDVCLGLLEMHSQSPPIAHRDLKIENILYCESSNRYKICDFGSATTRTFNTKQDTERNRAEDDINLFTTLFYRPPEMVDLYRGDIINEKVDIWALGCLLFKMAYYADPFDGGSLQIINNNYKIPENSRYSDRINGLIQFLLITSPVERPTIFDVCNRLQDMKGGKKVVYTPPPQRNSSSNSLSSSSNSTPSINNSPILSSNNSSINGNHQNRSNPNSNPNSNSNSPATAKKLFDILDGQPPTTTTNGNNSNRNSPIPVRMNNSSNNYNNNSPSSSQNNNNINNNSNAFNDGFDDFDAWGPNLNHSNNSVNNSLPTKTTTQTPNQNQFNNNNNKKSNSGFDDFGDLFSNNTTPPPPQQQQRVQQPPQQNPIKTSSTISDLDGLNWGTVITPSPSTSTKTSSSSIMNQSSMGNNNFEFGDFETFTSSNNSSPSTSTKNSGNNFMVSPSSATSVLTPSTSKSSPMSMNSSFNKSGSGGMLNNNFQNNNNITYNMNGSGGILQPMNNSPMNNSSMNNSPMNNSPMRSNFNNTNMNGSGGFNNSGNNYKPNYNIDLNSYSKSIETNNTNQTGSQQQQAQGQQQKVLNFDIFK